ncbi:MAG TPA: hypothetical protein VNX18_00280 [Bryobacteraceae bacterium]|nr:hypothetical protein [Bryobacteraceae bacterium]
MKQRTKKILWGMGGTFIALFPAMMLGHVEGPDVRHTGGPGDFKMSCGDPAGTGSASCHTNAPAPGPGGPVNAISGGSVAATFSTGAVYIPGGQPITITVTVTDPSTNPPWSGYYGFQMSARLDSDTTYGQAGHFATGAPNQGIFCDHGATLALDNNFEGKNGCGNYVSGPATGKPVVEFIEHAFPSAQSSAQKTPYTFTWTPPATNVGPVHFYLAGNAVNNDQNASGLDHVYNTSYVLMPGVALPPPSIATGGVLNAASLAKDSNGLGMPVAPGSLVQIYGSNLGGSTSDASTVPLPQSLAGVSVKFGANAARIKDVAPVGPFGDVNTFVNAQVPFGATPGSATVIATVNGIASPAETTTIVPSAPGIFTIPATGQGYGILVYCDPTLPKTCKVLLGAPTSVNLGYPTAPIPRGTNAFFYAAGLGTMTPPVADGDATVDPNNPSIVNVKPNIWIGDGTSAPVQATYQFAGQAPGFPGVYQVNIQIPSNAPAGDNLFLWLTTPDGSVTSNKAKISVK